MITYIVDESFKAVTDIKLSAVQYGVKLRLVLQGGDTVAYILRVDSFTGWLELSVYINDSLYTAVEEHPGFDDESAAHAERIRTAFTFYASRLHKAERDARDANRSASNKLALDLFKVNTNG